MAKYEKPDILKRINILCVIFLCFKSAYAQDDNPNILTYSIKEESDSGTVVGTVFADAGLESNKDIAQSGYLTFTESSTNVLSMFSISGGRDLTVGQRLDRDVICAGLEICEVHVDLQLQPPSPFRIIKVKVTILDVNDNAPHFSDTIIEKSISEAAAVGSKIPLPSADDPDSPEFGIDHYLINDTGDVFDLDRTTNPPRFLVLKQRLDRETKDTYQVQLTATDKGRPPNSGSTILKFKVEDVNDNLPQFDNEIYYKIIPEDFSVRRAVLTVHATDKDIDDNAQIVYGFDTATQNKYGDYFLIDSNTGVIKVNSPLDYETMPSAILTVTASNRDDTSMASFTSVHINIGDVNDNPPKIHVHGLNEDNVIFKEETGVLEDFVAHVTVTDPDSGSNSKFGCNLSGREFSLDKMYETEYVIQTNIPLDRETKTDYDVRMICIDEGIPRRTSTLDLKIRVADINDNTPKFTEQIYYATVVENNSVGVSVASVRATDPDSGVNGTIRYHFKNDVDTLLQIDDTDGTIRARTRVDRERISRIEAVVIASDQGTPERMSSSVTVIVDVIDQDDNSPEFSDTQYTFRVQEGQSLQSYVGQVTGSDPDTDLFNQFGYYITYDGGDSESFTIDRGNGKIYTSGVLNREDKILYSFQVRAVSDGPSVKADTALVTVHVDDINDKAPVIQYPNPNNNSVYLSNRTPVGTIISQILAFDLDDGVNAELSYFIVSGDEKGYFVLGLDGSVAVKKPLDEFDHRAFGLVIMVSDNGTPPRSTESYLNVVVNKSLSEHTQGLISHQNLTIVIAIATISGLVMVVLIVAIVMLLRWPRLRLAAARKYNYVARAHNQKLKTNESYDNPACDVENNQTNNSNNSKVHRNEKHKQRIQIEHQQHPTDDKMHSDIGYIDNNLVRQKARDSECSSSSSAAETDSGRGSHEDMVLDQSATGIQIDKYKEHPDISHTKNTNFPLLASIQDDHLRRPTNDRGWRESQRSFQGHPHAHQSSQHPPFAPYGRSTHSVRGSRETLPLDSQQPRDHSGYTWQSSHVSSEVHV